MSAWVATNEISNDRHHDRESRLQARRRCENPDWDWLFGPYHDAIKKQRPGMATRHGH